MVLSCEARSVALVPSLSVATEGRSHQGTSREEKALFLDNETIVVIAAIATILVALFTFFRFAIRTIRNRWHKRLKIEIALDPSSNPFHYKFRVTNLSQIPVTIDQMAVSLHKSKKKQPMWVNSWSTVEKFWSTGTEEKEIEDFSLRLDPKTHIEVNFDTTKNNISYEDVRALDQQGHGYVFAKMKNGCIIRCKFTPPAPPKEQL